MKSRLSRREFVAGSIGAAAAVPMLSISAVHADGHQVKLEETNPQAIALGYRHSAAEVDTTKFPRRAGEEGGTQSCSNCQLYNGSASDEWAPCAIFANKLVKGAGWCNAWVKKIS